MKDSSILRLSLFMGILGTIALFFIVSSIEPMQLNVIQVNHMDSDIIGSDVSLQGEIQVVQGFENMTLITLEISDMVKIVAFDAVNISKGQQVNITGNLVEYEGEYEVIADRIQVI